MSDKQALEKQIETMNKIANGNLSSDIKSSSKSRLQGAVIGGILGLVGAIALRTKPIYGIALGSIVGRILVNKMK